MEIRIPEKLSGSLGFSKRLYRSRTSTPPLLALLAVFEQVDVEAQALHLLREHVEALGEPGHELAIALDDRLVHAGAADDVVRLHGQELLERVGRAVRLHGPDLHLAQALATELRLAAE